VCYTKQTHITHHTAGTFDSHGTLSRDTVTGHCHGTLPQLAASVPLATAPSIHPSIQQSSNPNPRGSRDGPSPSVHSSADDDDADDDDADDDVHHMYGPIHVMHMYHEALSSDWRTCITNGVGRIKGLPAARTGCPRLPRQLRTAYGGTAVAQRWRHTIVVPSLLLSIWLSCSVAVTSLQGSSVQLCQQQRRRRAVRP
jgi:hypothetical protein